MDKWKSFPIYRVVLSEVQALWDELPKSDRPLLLRVEDRAQSPAGGSPRMGRIQAVWILDDHGPRLASMLGREKHDFGPAGGEYSRFGLVRFQVSESRGEVVLDYRLGPRIAGEIRYEIAGEGEDVQLLAHSGSLTQSG